VRPQALVSTKDITRGDWLEWRRRGIGSSDITAILGLSAWDSPLSVYLKKIGELPEDEENIYMLCGTLLEDDVAELFEIKTGLKPRNRYAILQHPDYPWALANLDRTLPAENGKGPGVLECKTAGITKRDQWEDDEVPDHVVLQVQWQLFVTGYKWAFAAALIGGNQFRYTRIERDEELIAMMRDRAAEFWGYVERRELPPVEDGSPATQAALAHLYPESTEASVLLGDDVRAMLHQRTLLDEELKERKLWRDEIDTRLKALLGDAAEAYLPGEPKPVLTYRTGKTWGLDAKALEREHPNIAANYRTKPPTRSLRINYKED